MPLAMNAARVLGSAPQRPPVRRGIRGVPLPDDVRRKAEQVLGADLSDVRIYVGPEAARMGALAFTMGTRVYFAPGQYDPTTKTGLWLLGHELTHVVQQRSGRVKNHFGYGVAVVKDEALEQEADRFAVQLAAAEVRNYKAEETVKSKKLKNAELNTYVTLREWGFAEGQIQAAGSGVASADFFAADGNRIWVVEVKGQNNWLSAANFANDGNVPAKQVGGKVQAKQATTLKGKTLFSSDEEVVRLNEYIAASADGYDSLLLGVTQLDVSDALLAFKLKISDDTIVGYHPLTLNAALNFIAEDKKLSHGAEQIRESWTDSPLNIRAWMAQNPEMAIQLSEDYTARRQAEAHELSNVTLPQLDEDHVIRLVPVIKFMESNLPAKPVQLKAAPAAPRIGGAPLQRASRPVKKREVTAEQREHIFLGTAVKDKKKKVIGVTGYHSKALGRAAIAEGFGDKMQTEAMAVYGCYWQAVRLRADTSIVKADGSTFFPDDWTAEYIIQAIETASSISGKSYLEVTTGPGRGMLIFKNASGYFPYFPE